MGSGPLVYSAIAMGAAVPDALEVTIRGLEPGDVQGEAAAHLGVVLERRGARTGDRVLGIVDSRFRGTPRRRRAG